MKLLFRLLAATAAAATVLLVPGEAFGWAETQRFTGLDALTGPAPAATLPTFPNEMSAEAVSELQGMPQRPVRIDVDADGTAYVLAQTPGVQVTGRPVLEGRQLAVDSLGRLLQPDGKTPYACDPEPATFGYLYTAGLMTVYRVALSTSGESTVSALKTFVTQSETGIPQDASGGGNVEEQDPPAGLALDRTAGSRRLYVSVPGRGVEQLSLETGVWSSFVEDDHNTWIPQENATETREDGEGAASLLRCIAGDTGVQRYHGTLWESGPTVPGPIAVDPSTRDVYVAEQHAVNGAESDRQYFDRLQVRRFSSAGAAISPVDFAVDPSRFPGSPNYPAPDGTQSGLRRAPSPLLPRWFLGTPLFEGDFDTRVAGMVFDADSGSRRLNVLHQVETLVGTSDWGTFTGQVAVVDPSATPAPKPTTVILAGSPTGSLAFGPVEPRPRDGIVRRGVVDIAARRDSSGATRLIVPATTGVGLLEMSDDGTPLNRIGGPSGAPCGFQNASTRLGWDRSTGTLLLLEVGAEPRILRLDPRRSGCPESDPVEETPRQPPTMEVVGALFTGNEGEPEPTGAFQPVEEGAVIEVEEDSAADGWVFSVRAEDPDNDGAPIGASATCSVVQPSGPFSISNAAWSACRARTDGGPSPGLGGLTVSKTRLKTAPGLTIQVTITIEDDESGDDRGSATQTFSVRLKPKTTAPLTATFTADRRSRDTFVFRPVLPPDTSFDTWRMSFGDAGVPAAQPESGFGDAFLMPRESQTVKFPVGTHTATLTLRRMNGAEVVEEFTATTTPFLVEAEQQQRPVTVVTPQGGAPCDTPLGIPLAQVGLGDQLLCVPADPCDVNTAELGLTKLPIVRPASCAGDDSSLFAAAEGSGPPPLGSRPIFLARTLRLAADRNIAARIRCGAGPSPCAGRVRMQLIRPGKAATTLGTTSFKDLAAAKTATVRVKVSAANARLLRRTTRPRVRVVVTPSVGATFTKPASHTRTVNLSAPPSRRTR